MEAFFGSGVEVINIKQKYYVLPENVSVNLKSYDILWLFISLGLGSLFIIFPLFS